MTKKLHNALLSAKAFSAVFAYSVADEIQYDIASNQKWRREAAEQLYAALKNIEIVEEEE